MKKMVLPSDQDASGRSFGQEELDALKEVIESGTLTATKGRFAKTLETQFAALCGSKYAFACASGTAAIHCAVAAIDPEPGDEIITSPITDMGAISPILYQGAVPVFADVDPISCNVTPESVAARISSRTKAIIVTHLFGNPCDMNGIRKIADAKNIPVIEDCAQAYFARYENRMVGTLGKIGCFSLQQGKHITCGEGGLVITDDPALARRIYLFINKAWGYGDPNPDHYFLALNYRISELQAAVAVAQLGKLEKVVEDRLNAAADLSAQLSGLPGIQLPVVLRDCVHSYWRYAVRVDPSVVKGGNDALAQILKECGIFTAPRYIKKPAFMCEVFQEQRTFGASRFPFTAARKEAIDYSIKSFPGTEEGLAKILVLPFTEKFTKQHIAFIADSMKEAVRSLASA
ncbi:MAG: DegT/DnrJ/EryC1/StrS family aminotransferase [Bdellovibrionota bacterium]